MEEYTGDIIRIDRLIDFLPSEYWEWDDCGKINLDDISIGIHECVTDVNTTKEIWILDTPNTVRRIDYEIVDPDFISYNGMILLMNYKLKRVKFQDNVMNLFNSIDYGDLSKLHDVIKEIGYGKFIYEFGDILIQRKGGKHL